MLLTIQLEELASGEFRASLEEMPSVFYTGTDPVALRERMERLVHALRSPHIKIDHVTEGGEVVLVLDRANALCCEAKPAVVVEGEAVPILN